MEIQKISTRCCIAGGGPAGIMLGYLLARAGIETVVLEKWPDFFRDFRGDTIHPSTMEVLKELGILEDFLALPHDKTYELAGEIGGEKVVIADFSRLRVQCPFIAFIPQWDFLNFLVSKAKTYPAFKLMMATEVTHIIQQNNKIIGLKAKDKDKNKEYEIYADLVVAADGRHSVVRAKADMIPEQLSVPMDVLWFKLPRLNDDPKQTLGKINKGRMLVLLQRGDYWQCGFLIRKNQYAEIVKAGLPAFQQSLAAIIPDFSQRIKTITAWDQIKLLQVTVDRLTQWYKSGLICIGDAAHAMSPIGGVGINLAIQDAVASANILIPAFQNGTPDIAALKAIQQRREFPTRVIQRMQIGIQDRVIDKVLGKMDKPRVPFMFKLMQLFPFLRIIPAFLVGIGIRPEHIKNRDKQG